MPYYTRLASDDTPSEERKPFDERPELCCQNNLIKYSRKVLIYNIILFVVSLGCLALSAHLAVRTQAIDGSRILREKTFYCEYPKLSSDRETIVCNKY